MSLSEVRRHIPWFGSFQNKDSIIVSSTISNSNALESPQKEGSFHPKFWEWSPFSFIDWAVRATNGVQLPTTINRGLKKQVKHHRNIETVIPNTGIRFRPYVSRVPWHTGPRGFLSQFFPRYGHYCGPNWSSGKDNGSPIWDKRPIDWLDFCCYCHDIGYDTHDQAELLKADLAFLECLEKPNMSTKGDPGIAYLYKFMCISGLQNILIPYRRNLLKLQSGNMFFPWLQFSNFKWKGLSFVPDNNFGSADKL